MPRKRLPPSEGVLVGVTILGVVALGLVVAGTVTTVATDGTPETTTATDRIPETTHLMTENESAVRIDVDCSRSRVELVVPEGHQYDVTVGVANVTPTSNSVSRSTFGPVEENATIELEEKGIVFAIVQNRSAGDEIAATDVTNCGDAGGLTTTTQRDAETETGTETRTETGTETETETGPAIAVDCQNGTVQFEASEETEYVAKVTVVELSATGTSTSSSTRTFEGNATVSIEADGLVAAFASTGELGDDRTASAVRNCSSFGTDADSTDETETTTT